MSAASASRARRAVRIMDLMKSFEILRASIPSTVLGLGSMVVFVASCGVIGNGTQNDVLGSTDGKGNWDSQTRDMTILVDAADGPDGPDGPDGIDGKDGKDEKDGIDGGGGASKDGTQDRADGPSKDGTQNRSDGTIKDGTQNRADGTIKDTLEHDSVHSDAAIEAKGTDSSGKSDRGSTFTDSVTVDGSLSGTTECSADGTCPTGYLCGGSSTAGGPDVCYDESVTGCDSSGTYYCPGSGTCWSEKIACSTVIECEDGSVSACVSESYTASCSSTATCTSNGSAGSDGGSGEAGTSVDVCSPASTDTACDTCSEQSCCAQLTACSNQTSCVKLVDCLSGCSSTDTACETGCESSYSAGISNLTALMTCLDSSCSVSCN